jgi:DnaJ domain
MVVVATAAARGDSMVVVATAAARAAVAGSQHSRRMVADGFAWLPSMSQWCLQQQATVWRWWPQPHSHRSASHRSQHFCVLARSSSASGQSRRQRPIFDSPAACLLARACMDSSTKATYFTNAQRLKQEDPYAALGLMWGATQTEIKAAFRQQASRYHPDVNTTDSRDVAIVKFQALVAAYEILTAQTCPLTADHSEWQWKVWFRSDVIAQERTDVAGVQRIRPVPPAEKSDESGYATRHQLGHPSGSGRRRRRSGGEYLSDGTKSSETAPSRSVGTGHNKWVTAKPYVAWTPPPPTTTTLASLNNGSSVKESNASVGSDMH